MGRPFSCSTNPLATARFAAVLHRFGQPTPLTGSHRPPLFPSRSSFSRTTPKRDGGTLDLFRCRRHFGAYFDEVKLEVNRCGGGILGLNVKLSEDDEDDQNGEN
ncbi:hypothetical protein V6N12_046210 [Hibiscus sabdariffa]|uniref:Uncharacterized protein n=1 Tax=Hibiscus sabdariffa TaxID=183260 RepID=A0ABR2AXM1_9ROSI